MFDVSVPQLCVITVIVTMVTTTHVIGQTTTVATTVDQSRSHFYTSPRTTIKRLETGESENIDAKRVWNKTSDVDDSSNELPRLRTQTGRHLVENGAYETISGTDAPPPQCRDRYGMTQTIDFRIRTCVSCFKYLIRAPKPQFIPHPLKYPDTVLVKKPDNLTMLFLYPDHFDVYKPDVLNMTSLEPVCRTLTRKQCEMWRDCCQNAVRCCDRQIGATIEDVRQCPGTWDGFACWGPTDSGTIVETPCPDYVGVGVDRPFGNPHAVKTCQKNGTWYRQKGREWTDYTTCLNVQAYRIGLMVSITTNGVSILLLVPAIIIFTSYRTLRRQHRIKVHSNFFASLLLCAVCSVLWDVLINHDMLSNHADLGSMRLHQNPAGCRVLSALKIYFSSTNYFWMFCEGYYLHRLLSDAFRPPENLISLYVIGWVVPAMPVLFYCVVRLLLANESCWVYTFGQWNMLYYIPNMVCLAINLLFLCNILRVITTRLHQHPNEPSNFRKALKAIFILIPLFGLQLFVTIYRPPKGSPGLREYDTFHSFITNSQGFFVAILFCFFNHEVMNHMRFSRCCCRGYRRPSRHHSYATSFSTEGSTLNSFRGNSCHGNHLQRNASSNSPRGKPKLDKLVSLESHFLSKASSSPSRAPILTRGRQRPESMELSTKTRKKPVIVTIRQENSLIDDTYTSV